MTDRELNGHANEHCSPLTVFFCGRKRLIQYYTMDRFLKNICFYISDVIVIEKINKIIRKENKYRNNR